MSPSAFASSRPSRVASAERSASPKKGPGSFFKTNPRKEPGPFVGSRTPVPISSGRRDRVLLHIGRREVDADAGHFGNPHFREAFFPASWKDLAVGGRIRRSLFQNQKVGNRRDEVQSRRSTNRPVRIEGVN